jgi:2-polyprenyl-6-methoxyphenol hydroxylase-like FAD-dependent oxidoreductase
MSDPMAEGPAEPPPSVFIMGAGVVGTALAAGLVRAGVPVTGLEPRAALR